MPKTYPKYAMTPAITPENLIPKLCFVIYGSPYEAHREAFRRDLYKHLRTLKEKPLTRQSIKYWIDKGSAPNRTRSLDFLYVFFKKNVRREILEPEKKKVYDQINAFFKKFNRENIIPKDKFDENRLVQIERNLSGRIKYDLIVSRDQNTKSLGRIEGLYYLVHPRLYTIWKVMWRLRFWKYLERDRR